MKEYQFQYTKTTSTVVVLLACFVSLVITTGLGIHFKMQEMIIYIIGIIMIVVVYKLLKRYTFGNCVAIINDINVEFDFGENPRIINFDDLISFKVYYGNKATVLYLSNTTDNFKLYANNYCDRKSFDVFCQDIIIQLDKYKSHDHPNIIHKGSVFTTKGMLYFLSIATLIYLLAFFIENKEASLYIGIGGGFYLLLMWFAYFNKRDLKSK
ncbi:MAG: hypothetical protein ABIU77_15065 [Ferruginibacter sp.]|jgi:hypothetical protein